MMDQKKVPFEEALTMTGYGKFNMWTMVLVSNVISAMASETSSVAYLVPASACELLTTPEQQGLMAGMPLFGILAASNVWGYLADTRGRRKTLILAMFLGFISGCSATLAPNWIVFCICKFISAASMAGTFGLGNTLLSECTPAARRSKLILLLCSVFAVSVGGMAAITIPVLSLKFSYYIPYLDIHFNAWRLLNIIFSLPCAIGILATCFSFESPKYLLSAGKHEQALDILRKIYEINNGEDGRTYNVSAVTLDEDRAESTGGGFFRSVVNQTVPLFKPPLLRHTLLLTTIFVSVYFCVNPFTVWLPFMIDAFMKSVGKGETGLTFCQMLRSSAGNTTDVENTKFQPDDCSLDSTAMLSMVGLEFILAALNILMCSLLSCFQRKTLLITIQLAASAVAMMMNFSTVWIVTALFMLVYMIGMLNFGLLSTFSVDMFPTYVKAMGVCLTLMIGRGSAVLGINLLKNLLTYHCEATFYVFGSISIVGGIFGFLLPSDKRVGEKDVEVVLPKQINGSKNIK